MNENPLDPKANSDSTDSLPGRNSVEPILTRRSFLGKIIALGALTHFKLLDSLWGGTPDPCPYGKAENDICDPQNGNPDKCEDGTPENDECTIESAPQEDVCGSGMTPDDVCISGGSPAEGDVCRGGGSHTGEEEQDNCDNDIGDVCTTSTSTLPGSGGHDNCKGTFDSYDMCDNDTPDTCGSWPLINFSDDTCPNGTNAGEGPNGATDWCTGGARATDACYDGSDKQDLCAGRDNWWGNGDVCFGHETDHCGTIAGDDDICPGGEPENNEDICIDGDNDEDICPGGLPAVDYCPGGGANVDICLSGIEPEDECDLYAKEPD